MSYSQRDRAAASAIVGVHETGKLIPNYSSVAVVRREHWISYGSHQATHRSGTLYKIVKLYCDVGQTDIAKELADWLALLKRTDEAAMRKAAFQSPRLHVLLRDAGKDREMQYAQNTIFNRNYLDPAEAACQAHGWVFALSLAAVFDSIIQGSWPMLRDRVRASSKNEKAWIAEYVRLRREWLRTHPRLPVLHATVYRMDTYLRCMKADNWKLITPINAHGHIITEQIVQHHQNAMALRFGEAAPILDIAMAAAGAIMDTDEPDLPAADPRIEELWERNTEGIADSDADGIPDFEDPDFLTPPPERGSVGVEPDRVGIPPAVEAHKIEKVEIHQEVNAPVRGGGPNDPPVEVPAPPEQPVPDDLPFGQKVSKTLKGYQATIAAWATANIAGLIAWLRGGVPRIVLLIVGVGVGALLLYAIMRMILTDRREKRTQQFAEMDRQRHHELTLAQFNSVSDPKRINAVMVSANPPNQVRKEKQTDVS